MSRAAIAALLWVLPLLGQEPFDPQALMQVQRITDPQLSPDGKTVAFVVQRIDLENNRRPTQIYTVPLGLGEPRQITQEGETNERPRWSPDSRQIAFISDRSGTPQVWLMNADGSNPRQVTRISTGASGVLFSPDGKRLVFTSEVYPDCPDEACNQRRLEQEKASKIRARVYDSLLYRHWNRWRTARRKHLFVVQTDGAGLRDLTPGNRDVPPFSLGGPDDYDISPDGQEVCFVMNADPEPAVSTNSDLYVVPITGGDPVKVTVNPGADHSPKYSPDGRFLAYRTQPRAGYESDRWRLVVMQRASGEARILTENLDRWVNSFAWSPDSSQLFFTLEDRGRQGIQMIPVGGGAARVVASGAATLDDIQFTPDGKTMIYTERSAARPTEIFRVSSSGGSATALTHLNDRLLSQYELNPPEEFWTAGAEQTQVHSFLLKPPGFQPNRKYPVLMLIHGGPQSAWAHNWSYRWNAQVFAAAGYVVVMPNPRGSTGYGQKFIDEINGDWGGRAYQDLMAVADAVARLPYVDPDRMAAAGASYGGYMVNWILGHTSRFKALVSHAGVFDLRSKFGETEELWFPLWEFRGAPWDDPQMYERWSPSNFVKEFKTPTLVTHGELDFRVPFGQGLQLFTALQLQKVPSKLILFPDEGHWITQPQNSVFWYRNVIGWLDRWLRTE
ncbi:MAG: S9 family peptidase [Bryobacteraceae bacterium]|nr:S9 family peptidase [Bryobacteraceae bacterium]